MKKILAALLLCLLLPSAALPALAEERVLEPVRPVPAAVAWVLETAAAEVGYREDKGYTKYGEWAGDPYCQWCAEFLCWCVDQVDQQHGTSLLTNTFPRYSGSNTGRSWFIKEGRFAVRSGEVEGWGYEWLRGGHEFLKTGSYIPQPGDYVFFSWTSGTDTDHVALVEYCTQDDEGNILIHVIEGNNPVAVARNTYSLMNTRILGFGIVHGDLVDITMRPGNRGKKVLELQDLLIYTGYLEEGGQTGAFDNPTQAAVRQFQGEHHLRVNGIANMDTQTRLREEADRIRENDPKTWTVVDDDED